MALHLSKITDANSIMAAREAKLCILQLEYEYDPCSDSPEKLIWNLEKEEVRMFRHQETSVDLLALDQKILLTGDFEGLVDPVQTYWKCRAPLLWISSNTSSLNLSQLLFTVLNVLAIMREQPSPFHSKKRLVRLLGLRD
ncbi:hypothetical protein J7T55_010709 [Diaporthe amygdali]|uniref:uncharacterized protein n=1 Tax=Phomopsis amygdali TaxID=1214568 RepID=UPI0022FF457E|nr:uncharacterized protein J7T55_010709 [Diaporthe amygdali]KAJ0114320.1 hypothetical protein J7T55_010709 [Diaporthe amygdali]